MQKDCAQCGEVFEAKRSTAKYCGDRCRQQARRKVPAAEAEAIEPRLPSIVTTTQAELTRIGKLDTVLGAQAMTLAQRMTSMKDTGSAIAALSRELDRVMLRVAAGAAKQEDQLASARRRRDEKRRAAAEAREA
ncbi:hypothetical protein [Nocardioides soli]|uniref:Uncharacterized protein YoxC n=1 Tax=Nocardioides soli TaxID=1036020 RepID=A0A7W4Z0Q3_9ACTN|nr:hypothetical protein [Nocardioides soli]MBB3041011.1 uncharacterized protein YoxC [Nocardioides soli]